jgi:hypothetical protein
MAQRKRKAKTSKGERVSSRPVHLSVVEKVNLGHGMLDSTEQTDCKPWRGVGEIRGPVFNQAQADENRRTMPHLFSERVR